MFNSLLAVVAISLLVSVAMWVSLRIADGADLTVLPASCRKRLEWWRINARNVYAVCAVFVLGTVVLQLTQLGT